MKSNEGLMISERELAAIEETLKKLRAGELDAKTRRWATRCRLLAREVRRLTALLDADPTIGNTACDDTAVY
ncbi:MAG: hypothetical protein KF774_04435 [Planctomyces sp.]|nr:hypothetical protein [Planctomyces sp.]